MNELLREKREDFDKLMNISDTDLRRMNSNERALNNDPVYTNSDRLYRLGFNPEEITESLFSRKLGEFSPESFIKKYNSAINIIKKDDAEPKGFAWNSDSNMTGSYGSSYLENGPRGRTLDNVSGAQIMDAVYRGTWHNQ
jgi:hypothetical protein